MDSKLEAELGDLLKEIQGKANRKEMRKEMADSEYGKMLIGAFNQPFTRPLIIDFIATTVANDVRPGGENAEKVYEILNKFGEAGNGESLMHVMAAALLVVHCALTDMAEENDLGKVLAHGGLRFALTSLKVTKSYLDGLG